MSIFGRSNGPCSGREEPYGELRQSKVQVAPARLLKDCARPLGRFCKGVCLYCPEDNVQFRLGDGDYKPWAPFQPCPKLERCIASGFQPLGELAAGLVGQQLLRRPKRDRGCASSRALQRDLAQMQFLRGEVRVRGVVLVEAAYARIVIPMPVVTQPRFRVNLLPLEPLG